MSQDKLEEIACLLGGISDKLDVVVRSLTPADRIEVRKAEGPPEGESRRAKHASWEWNR